MHVQCDGWCCVLYICLLLLIAHACNTFTVQYTCMHIVFSGAGLQLRWGCCDKERKPQLASPFMTSYCTCTQLYSSI
jgi:hypothetical protein